MKRKMTHFKCRKIYASITGAKGVNIGLIKKKYVGSTMDEESNAFQQN
jgi:hypothetical protein